MKAAERPKRNFSRRTLLLTSLAALAIVSSVAIATGLTLIFTQTIPGNTESTAAIQEGCSTPSPATQVPLGGGGVIVGCGGLSWPAFNVTSLADSLTPTFTVPGSGVAGLYVFSYSGGIGECSTLTHSQLLTDGAAVTFPQIGGYDYCIDATAAYAGFSVGWSE